MLADPRPNPEEEIIEKQNREKESEIMKGVIEDISCTKKEDSKDKDRTFSRHQSSFLVPIRKPVRKCRKLPWI